jgi:hypothetical protein
MIESSEARDAGNKDLIVDNDGKGSVYFEGKKLLGGLLDKTDETKKRHTLTINNYDKATSSLGIDLHDVRVSVKIGDNFERVVA